MRDFREILGTLTNQLLAGDRGDYDAASLDPGAAARVTFGAVGGLTLDRFATRPVASQ
jgi:hypothetical protein